jgi:FHA domain
MSAMATYQCPKGHTSTEPDYCSECGAPIGSSTGAGATASATAPSTGPELCPDCQTPRTPGARFCEVCRYDFEKRASSGHGSPSAVEPAATIAPPTVPTGQAGVAPAVTGAGVDAAAAVGTPAATSAQRLNVVVVTDPSLVTDDDMRKQCPQNAPDLVFPLDLDESLVGRRSDIRNIFPEIDLDDVGVSHRQLKLLRQPDGSFAALELGSANGTTLNGVALKPGLVTPVAAGDELLVGLWTRLQLRSR